LQLRDRLYSDQTHFTLLHGKGMLSFHRFNVVQVRGDRSQDTGLARIAYAVNGQVQVRELRHLAQRRGHRAGARIADAVPVQVQLRELRHVAQRLGHRASARNADAAVTEDQSRELRYEAQRLGHRAGARIADAVAAQDQSREHGTGEHAPAA